MWVRAWVDCGLFSFRVRVCGLGRVRCCGIFLFGVSFWCFWCFRCFWFCLFLWMPFIPPSAPLPIPCAILPYTTRTEQTIPDQIRPRECCSNPERWWNDCASTSLRLCFRVSPAPSSSVRHPMSDVCSFPGIESRARAQDDAADFWAFRFISWMSFVHSFIHSMLLSPSGSRGSSSITHCATPHLLPIREYAILHYQTRPDQIGPREYSSRRRVSTSRTPSSSVRRPASVRRSQSRESAALGRSVLRLVCRNDVAG